MNPALTDRACILIQEIAVYRSRVREAQETLYELEKTLHDRESEFASVRDLVPIVVCDCGEYPRVRPNGRSRCSRCSRCMEIDHDLGRRVAR